MSDRKRMTTLATTRITNSIRNTKRITTLATVRFIKFRQKHKESGISHTEGYKFRQKHKEWHDQPHRGLQIQVETQRVA